MLRVRNQRLCIALDRLAKRGRIIRQHSCWRVPVRCRTTDQTNHTSTTEPDPMAPIISLRQRGTIHRELRELEHK